MNGECDEQRCPESDSMQEREEECMDEQQLQAWMAHRPSHSQYLVIGEQDLPVPDAVRLLKGRVRFIHAKCPVETIPAVLLALANAKVLNFDSCSLRSLPADISRLSKLTTLSLCDNCLTGLPAAIGDLRKLTDLHVSQNQLQALPPFLGRLHSLRKLEAANNCLASLPDELSHLTALQYLSLAQNNFETFPSCIAGMRALKTLVFSDNPLEAVPLSIARCSLLSKLLLHRTSIHSLPCSLLAVRPLSTVGVDGCPNFSGCSSFYIARPKTFANYLSRNLFWCPDTHICFDEEEQQSVRVLLLLYRMHETWIHYLPTELMYLILMYAVEGMHFGESDGPEVGSLFD